MTKNVTILTDENGVKREYNEVKRKANVGERIKIVRACMAEGKYDNGDVLVVTKSNVHDEYVEVGLKYSDGSNVIIDADEYIVLEPTSTVIIDGVRYREEKREARVGDLIYYPEDQRLVVVVADEDDLVNGECTYYSTAMKHPHIVLTPIDETKPAEQTSSAPQTVINVNLTLTIQPGEDVARTVADAVKAELHKMAVSNTPALRKSTEKTPQQIRDEIVERAKADVAELLCIADDREKDLPGASPLHNTFFRVEFVINREKRTVVALVRKRVGDRVVAKGIAKCAPGDVFNTHIGRAIALRRALGLTVPTEYLNAPKPTEVRVGDIVTWNYPLHTYKIAEGMRVMEHGHGSDDVTQYADLTSAKVIDDSREEVSA